MLNDYRLKRKIRGWAVDSTPSSAGSKTAALHIASNDSDENPFDINLTGLSLSLTADTDGENPQRTEVRGS